MALTKREIRQEIERLQLKLRYEVTPFGRGFELSQSERRERGRKDVEWFLRTYFPHYFPAGFAGFHREIIEAYAGVVRRVVVVEAFRGAGKSALCAKTLPIWEALYGRKHYVMVISDTEDLAEDIVGFILLELEENQRLRQDFEIGIEGGKKDFVVNGKTRFQARGQGQPVRGRTFKQWRVDRVIVDDYENEKQQKNKKIVAEKYRWLVQTVIPALYGEWQMVYLGTPLSRHCVLKQMEEAVDEEGEKRYLTLRYPLVGADGKSVWAERFSESYVAEIRRQIGSRAFKQEYLLKVADDESVFKEEWIREYHPLELPRDLRVVTFFDPATGRAKKGDYHAIVTYGEDGRGQGYVLDAWIKRRSEEEALEALYQRYDIYRPQVIGIEDNLFQNLFLTLLSEKAKEKGYVLPVRGITHRTNKEIRIEGLSPYVERGAIWFCPKQGDQELLIEQLLDFPNGEHDDGVDALEGAFSLMRARKICTADRIRGGRRREMVEVLAAGYG